MVYVEPLDGFFEKANSIVPKTQPTVEPDFNSLNRDAFIMAIPNIPNMDEHQIAILVKNNIDSITDQILSGKVPYINLFSDINFINGFIRALSSIPISYKIQLACNKLTYDYFTADVSVPEIKQKYLNVSKVINRAKINELMALGIDENTASNLCLCRYSSTSEYTGVKRLNFTLYHKDHEFMNEQMIVWIYEKMFDRVSPIFYGVMFEVYTKQQEEDFGDNFTEVYGTVGLVALDILNNMTSEDIQKILTGYSKEWEFRGRPPVRFSLRSLSADYSHIQRVVDHLIMNGTQIP